MPFSLVLDVLIAILLVVTIMYAFTLNRRLAELRKDQTELEKLAASFNDATLRAEESIQRLTGSSEEMKRDMQDTLRRAQGLQEDLNYLIERAGEAADKLEGAVRNHRPEPPAYSGQKIKDTVTPPPVSAPTSATKVKDEKITPEPTPRPSTHADDDFKPKTDAERELLKALQSVR